MKILLRNLQQVRPPRIPALRRLARRLTRLAFPDAPPAGPFDTLSVLLVDNDAMPGYKAATFGVRLQTDVISQAYLPVPGLSGPTAELVINLQRALEYGQRRPGGPSAELALYLAHGIDHLAGHDDATPADRRSMRRRELRWLARLSPLPLLL